MNKLKDKLLKELNRFLTRIVKLLDPEKTPESTTQEPQVNPPPQEEQPMPQPQKPQVKVISFGSPNCSNAQEDPNTQIKDLKWSKNGLSYKWAKGNLRNWGILKDHDAGALAITGHEVKEGEEYRCSKFDWISTDRLTRGFENIHGRYNGFDPEAYFGAKKHAFFIMTSDGKKRTNILVV
jgi:hypothetical protein